jgi:mono/diheme cytochrome c family protein
MIPRRIAILFTLLSLFAITALFAAPQQQAATASADGKAQQALVTKYCVTCHGDKLKTAGLVLENLDVTHPAERADVWEKVVKKMATGAMPPQGMPRPSDGELSGLKTYLETTLDKAAVANPNPGRAAMHRLNRTEYANAVHDILNLDIDATALLPADDESYGFDNIAEVLKTSPSLIERYMTASWKVSRLAVGNTSITPDTSVYRVRPDLSQDGHIEGLPLGTHGGTKFVHNFPLDGEYEFRVRMWRATTDIIRGIENRQNLEISIDGVRVKLIAFGGKEDAKAAFDNSGLAAIDIDNRLTVRVPVKAGPRTVTVTFLPRSAAQEDDILQPFLRSNVDPVGYQGQPSVDRVTIMGPFKATGPGDTPSRRAIFICRPKTSAEEVACARKIVSNLARKAYRRPANENDIENLLTFYQKGRNEGKSFDSGIEAAIQLILASPEFIYRFEADPKNLAQDAVYKLGDMELASRLSFFLWSTIPDEQLITVASQGKLKDPVAFDQQVRRMMKDPRSKALVENFAGQWLFLRNLRTFNPDFETFPDFDDNLRNSMRHETELLFDSVMREDRSVMDLLTADYTFVNERLARHYGMTGIYGSEFRRVPVMNDSRRGILGQASILTVTSLPTRTSAVQRGKWIMTNLLGTPPPPPPPNVPALQANQAGKAPKSLRERMEAHRANPFCAQCHKVMDPIGFTLENFDAVGQWRDNDEGAKIDVSGTLFNGYKVSTASDLRKMLTDRPEVFLRVFTEKLMTYALGRGPEYYDMPTIRQIVRDASKNDYKFSSFVMGIVKSTPFQMKKKTPEGNVTASLR